MYRLLLVDDEKMVLVSVKHSVDWKTHHFSQILETTDPEQALSLLRRFRIDAAFLDIRMPGSTAFDIIEKSRVAGYPFSQNFQTTFVILTGYSDFQYAKKAINLGVFDYVLKPLQPEECELLLPRLSERLWKQRLFSDPKICEKLYSDPAPKTLLSWIGAPYTCPHFGALFLKCPSMNADTFSRLGPMASSVLLCSTDQAIIFLGSDTDPLPDIRTFLKALSDPCAAAYHELGQDLSQLPSALARLRRESDKAFERSISSREPVLIDLGYHQLQAGDDTFLSLIHEIEERASQELSLAELADKYNISYAYCSNLFNQRMGTTFSQYIRKLRMQKAKDLLKNTRLPVNLISEQVGYPDYHHFAKIFRKEFGMTPSEFRSSQKEQQ